MSSVTNLTETAAWEAAIYCIQTTDPVVGGDDGISNLQAKQLGNRTAYLKAQVESAQGGLAAHVAAADPHPQYAPKESPTFTGTPKAPTPAAGDNSQRLATTAYVLMEIAALVNGSPAALDTLKELADALGDDANFAATMTNALALKAPLASPALTGTPTAPTPALFDKSLKLATMAALQRALGNFHDTTVIQVATALTADDTGKVLSVNIGGFAVTLPAGATLTNGACVLILATAACTVQRAGADVIYTGNGASTVTSLALGIGDSVFLVWNGGSWVLQGGSAQLQFAGVFGASLGASGYQKLPSGLIVQWGSAVTNASGVATLTLPIAFPSIALANIAQYSVGILSTNVCNSGGVNKTTAQAIVTSSSGAAAAGATVNFLVLGM